MRQRTFFDTAKLLMQPKLRTGQWVRIHPATDQFMRGILSAQIVTVGSKWVRLAWGTYRFKVSYGYARDYFMTDTGELLVTT